MVPHLLGIVFYVALSLSIVLSQSPTVHPSFRGATRGVEQTTNQPPIVQPSRQDKQEQTVYITRTGEKYHRGDCRYLSKSKIAIKRKDAIARGYNACKVCKP